MFIKFNTIKSFIKLELIYFFLKKFQTFIKNLNKKKYNNKT